MNLQQVFFLLKHIGHVEIIEAQKLKSQKSLSNLSNFVIKFRNHVSKIYLTEMYFNEYKIESLKSLSIRYVLTSKVLKKLETLLICDTCNHWRNVSIAHTGANYRSFNAANFRHVPVL